MISNVLTTQKSFFEGVHLKEQDSIWVIFLANVLQIYKSLGVSPKGCVWLSVCLTKCGHLASASPHNPSCLAKRLTDGGAKNTVLEALPWSNG